MARICLVYFDIHTGHYPGFHHGLASLIGALRRENHEVSLQHVVSETDFPETITHAKAESPVLVGLSFTTNQKKYVKKFLETTRFQVGLVVAGGVHATLVKDQIFENFPNVNGVCIGEGEVPLVELCRRLDKKEDYFSVPSFYFKRKEGIIKNHILPLQGIDTLALPDYSLFDYQSVISDSGDCFPMMINRGCPYDCTYCCNHAMRRIYPNKKQYVRFHSVQHAMSIIENNLSLYPMTEKIVFADDTFTLKKGWLAEFCEAYRRRIDIPFICNARIETIDEDIVQSLKSAGCISVEFGIESGNESLRKDVLNRKYSNSEIKEAFNVCKKHGIKTFSYNMVGLPFETKEMAKDTLNLNLYIQPNHGACFYFYPYPGTNLYKICKKYDLFLNDLEGLSGYKEAPSIKERFMAHSEMIKHFELLKVYFYSRLLFSKIQIPYFLYKKLLLKIIFCLRKPILMVLNPNSSNSLIRVSRKMIRKYAIRYLR